MDKVKVTKVNAEDIEFSNGMRLYSEHEQDCCENHYLSFEHLTLADFEGLEFDLTSDTFFERIDGYGVALIPLEGHPVRIPGYGSNNGYYSSQLELVLGDERGVLQVFDISDCQEITD